MEAYKRNSSRIGGQWIALSICDRFSLPLCLTSCNDRLHTDFRLQAKRTEIHPGNGEVWPEPELNQSGIK